jgi:hypothetical protein
VKVVEHPLGIGHQVEADLSGFTGAPGVWVTVLCSLCPPTQ